MSGWRTLIPRYCCIIGVWAEGSLAMDMDGLVRGSGLEFGRQVRGDDLQHLAEDFRAGRDDVARLQKTFVAHEISDQCPGCLCDQAAGGQVPGFLLHYPEDFVAAACHVVESERGGAGTAQA